MARIDTSAPTIIAPADVTIDCDDSTAPADCGDGGGDDGDVSPKAGKSHCNGLATATDNCTDADDTYVVFRAHDNRTHKMATPTGFEPVLPG